MTNFNLPVPQDPNPQVKIITQSFGLGLIKTAVYKAGMPANMGQGKSYGVSKLGTPVFSNLDISAFSYTDNNGKTVNVPAILFDTVLFSVTQDKNIIVTDIQGRDSGVIEYISKKNYSVEIMGVLNADNRNFPLQDMQDLIALLDAPVSFNINSWYLALFGITRLCIRTYSLGQEEGRYSNQRFQIQAISDVPIELQINA